MKVASTQRTGGHQPHSSKGAGLPRPTFGRLMTLLREHRVEKSAPDIDVDALLSLPQDSLGYTLATALKAQGIRLNNQGYRRDRYLEVYRVLLGFGYDSQSDQALEAWFLGASAKTAHTLGLWAQLLANGKLAHRHTLLDAYRLGKRCAVDPDKFPAERLWARPIEQVRILFNITENHEKTPYWRFDVSDYGHESVRSSYAQLEWKKIAKHLMKWRPWKPVIEDLYDEDLIEYDEFHPEEEKEAVVETAPTDVEAPEMPQYTNRRTSSDALIADISQDFELFLSSFSNKPIGYAVFRTIKPWILAKSRQTGVLIPPVKLLRTYPEGSLGHEYAKFIQEIGFVPVRFGKRRHQFHDVYHLLMGFDIDPQGEQLLHGWFLGTKFFHLNIMILTFWLAREDWKLNAPYVGEAFLTGRNCAIDPDTFPAEHLWAWPIEDVRALFGIKVSNPHGDSGRFPYYPGGHRPLCSG